MKLEEQNEKSVCIRAGFMADAVTGSSKRNWDVLVINGRIAAVGPREVISNESPPGTEMLDFGDNACVTPGLIDGHTHLSLSGPGRSYTEMFSDSDEIMMLVGASNLQTHLSSGVTTLREHGARNRIGFVLKEGLAKGYIAGPRMQVSGRPITRTGGHFHMCNEVADGELEVRRSVRRLVSEGADYIKIMASGGGTPGSLPACAAYSVDELHAIAHEAHHFHRPTVAHCRATESMVRAVKAGIDLIEHAEFLAPDYQMIFDPKVAEMLVEAGVWISPTLSAWTNYPRMKILREQQEFDALSVEGRMELKTLEEQSELRLDIMRRMLDYGMKDRVVPGTDAGTSRVPFGHMDYDLQLLVQLGFTPGEALMAATRVSAEAIGLADAIGTIEPGKIADLAVFGGDPTADIGAITRVIAVFQEGQRVS